MFAQSCSVTRPSIDAFVATVREFVGLVDSDLPVELFDVRRLLLLLQFHITAVETAPHAADSDGIRPDDDSYRRAVGRFGGLGFDFYRVVFDPHHLDATEDPVFGNLSDDLADIYRDLADGLSMAEAGHIVDACREWSFSYQAHWARHASHALVAIELYRTEHFLKADS